MASDDLGPMGLQLAAALTDKIVEAIDGFPTPAPNERAAIAEKIAEALTEYAIEDRQ